MPRPSRLLCLLLAFAAPLAAHAAPTYTVATITDLSKEGGQPMGINNAGQVAGYAYASGRGYAYVSKDGSTTSLHPANGPATGSSGRGINEAGAVVGDITTSGSTRAAVFANGSVRVLGTLGGNYSSGYAINANGSVAGVADTASGERHGFVTGANGSLVDIGPLGGGYSSAANGINDKGAVTGYLDIDDQGNYRSYVYADGMLNIFNTLGGNYAEGLAINESGMVTGYSFVAGDTSAHAVLYVNGMPVDLGDFGGSQALGTAINEAGDVVGTGNDADGNWHAFVYSGGKFQDLNDLVDPSLGWNFVYAGGINDKGQIAARACQADFRCADLLLTLVDQGGGDPDPNPVPEPEAFSAGLIGLALLRALRRRQQR